MDQRLGVAADEQISVRPPPIHPQGSPFWPRDLVDLFIRPRTFFSGQLALGRTPYLVLVMWCYGISTTISQTNGEIMRAELGRPKSGWLMIAPWVLGSWAAFWALMLVLGAVGGVTLWLLGGWWYRVRLRWSGARQPDARLARLAFAYSSFISAGPAVLLAGAETIRYVNYGSAYAAGGWWPAILGLVFPFWSLGTSYVGARTLFDVAPWKARAWFVLLPTLAYAGGFGLLAALLRWVRG